MEWRALQRPHHQFTDQHWQQLSHGMPCHALVVTNIRYLPHPPTHSGVHHIPPGLVHGAPSDLGRMVLLVVILLLLMSGDVEMNPGPLSLADLRTLLTDLESIRAKWYNFGLQLRVDVGILDSIKVQYSDPLDCLRETLKHWLKTSSNCTWKCIVGALSSPIVGDNALALDLERKHCPQLDTHTPLAQTPYTQEQVLYRQASTPTLPQGPPAAKRPCYSSVGSSSSPTPAMARYACYLRACYSRSSLPENKKFPPTPSKHYINLAYIARRTMSKHESDQFKLAMVRGEIDQIAHDKGLDFSRVAERLPDGSYPQVVLVEGAPGVGKTTFAWEFCKTWGKGELKQEYSLVILLRLRDKRIQEAKCLSDLFYHPDETLPDDIAKELINSLGEGVLIFLEGLDELPESQRTESSLFLDLIHGCLLPLATVLITTRPWASEYLHKNCKEKISQHVEILGFTKQQINNYLQSVCKPDDDPSLLPDIEKYLSCFPQIHAAMYIPLNAAIVVQVYRWSRTGECIIPKTMTQLYTALSQTLLIRYLGEHPVHKKAKWKIHNFSDLPSDVYEHFLQLSKVAYDSIKDDQKLVFSSEDLPDNIETLGFMQSVPELYVNESFSHNFLHLTIQEYLAAVHIAQLSPEEQLKHFSECEGGLFKVVMRFVAGLTKFAGIPPDSVRALFERSEYYSYYTANSDHVNWMFETQDYNTMNAILGSGNTIRFEDIFLMPFDYYCLGYCITQSHCWWDWMVYNIAEEDINMLIIGGSALHKPKQTTPPVSTDISRSLVSTLMLLPSLKAFGWSTMLSLGGLRELCDLLASTSNNLKRIIIIRAECDVPSYVTIEGRYQHTSVSVEVSISSVDDVTSTVSVLTENSKLGLHITAIRLQQQCKSVDGDLACQLAEVLHDTSTLETLEISLFHIGTKGAMAIAKLIFNSKSLRVVNVGQDNIYNPLPSPERDLSLGNNKLIWKMTQRTITVEYLKELCDLLASSSNRFKHIYIDFYRKYDNSLWCDSWCDSYYYDDDGNSDDDPYESYVTIEGKYQHTSVSVDVYISSVGDVTSAVSVLTENSNIRLHFTAIRLHKQCESIDGDLAYRLADALYVTTTLETFEVIHHPIGTKGAMAIAKLLHHNKSLMKVDVSKCNIGSEGICHLTQALCENARVKILDLSNNPIGTKGAMALAKLIQCNKSLMKVDVSRCNIGSEGTCCLAQALCEDTMLRELYLSCNPIGQDGAVALAEMLHNNTSLRILDLYDLSTPLGEEGTRKLLEAMKFNCNLQLTLPEECRVQRISKTSHDSVKFQSEQQKL